MTLGVVTAAFRRRDAGKAAIFSMTYVFERQTATQTKTPLDFRLSRQIDVVTVATESARQPMILDNAAWP